MSSVNFTVFLPCGWYSSKPDSRSSVFRSSILNMFSPPFVYQICYAA
nr:MAG TPA: hypothetical protein [Caudoviricetes sp.]DAL29577.1 MAG TPA_asm: hypothetical protein [Caudoviricetes sp.]